MDNAQVSKECVLLDLASHQSYRCWTCGIRHLLRVEGTELAYRGRCFAIPGGLDGFGQVLYLDCYSRLLSISLHSVPGEQCLFLLKTLGGLAGNVALTAAVHCMF